MTATISAEQAREVLAEADLICSAEQVNAALDRLATAINARFEGLDHFLKLRHL